MTIPKKIVRVITRLNIGGPAIHTVLLSGELHKRGYRDVLVCGKGGDSEGDMMYLAAENGVAPIVIPELAREISIVKDFKSFLALLSIMKREKPDIVHTHTAKAGTLGRMAAICAGVPVKIHTFHGHVLDGYFGPVKAGVFLLIERMLACFTDRIVVVSEHIKHEIVDKLRVTSASKCAVVPLGFDLGRFLTCEGESGSFRRELNVSPDELLVGIVGRLVPIKNHMMFLRIVKNMTEKGMCARIKFVIIGDGECAALLKEEARKSGLEGRVVFTGWRRDLAPVYADLDVVALTSLNEGTPVSLIEACACAKPIVATDVGGVKDIIFNGKNGYLVESNDVEGFSNKLADLLADSRKRSRFGIDGRESVKSRYSKERLVKDIEILYEDCLRNKGRVK